MFLTPQSRFLRRVACTATRPCFGVRLAGFICDDRGISCCHDLSETRPRYRSGAYTRASRFKPLSMIIVEASGEDRNAACIDSRDFDGTIAYSVGPFDFRQVLVVPRQALISGSPTFSSLWVGRRRYAGAYRFWIQNDLVLAHCPRGKRVNGSKIFVHHPKTTFATQSTVERTRRTSWITSGFDRCCRKRSLRAGSQFIRPPSGQCPGIVSPGIPALRRPSTRLAKSPCRQRDTHP